MPSRRDMAVIGLVLTMEILAGYVLIIGLGATELVSPHYQIIWLLWLVGFFGVVAGLSVASIKPPDPWNRVTLLGSGSIGVVPVAFLTSQGTASFELSVVFLALAFWRGALLTQDLPTHEDVHRRFGQGLSVIFAGVVIVVARGVEEQRSIWQLVAVVGVGYTLFSLLGLAVTRVERNPEPGSVQAVVFAVAVQIGSVLLLGFVGLLIFGNDFTGLLDRMTRPVRDVLITVIGEIAVLLLTPLGWIIDRIHIHGHLVLQIQAPHRPINPANHSQHFSAHAAGTAWLDYLGFAVIALVVATIGVIVLRIRPSLPTWARDRGFTESRRSLWSARSLWADIRCWIRAMFGRGAELTGETVASAKRRILGPVYSTDPVRRIYGQLLYRAATHGISRSPGITPREFSHTLSAHWPEGAIDIERLTVAYELRRYGELTFGESDVHSLQECWHRLRRLMRKNVTDELREVARQKR